MAQYLGKVVYLLRGRLRLIEFPADHPSVAPQWVHKIEHDGYRLAEALQGRLALPAEVVARSESSYMRDMARALAFRIGRSRMPRPFRDRAD